MKKVKFSPQEEIIMSEIDKNGEYLWDQSPLTNHKKVITALKSLMWRGLITRKPSYGNVFIITGLGEGAMRWNEAVNLSIK